MTDFVRAGPKPGGRCEIIGKAVYDHPGGYASGAGTARAVLECVTHGMPVATMRLPGPDLCPIGRIEAATEAALAKIEQKTKGIGDAHD